MSPANLRPSAGFLLVVFSYSVLVAILVWGFSTPELDRVWLITQQMHRRSFAGLSANDVQTLRTALLHYPTLPRAFIGQSAIGFVEPTSDGWMSLPRPYVVASAQASGGSSAWTWSAKRLQVRSRLPSRLTETQAIRSCDFPPMANSTSSLSLHRQGSPSGCRCRSRHLAKVP